MANPPSPKSQLTGLHSRSNTDPSSSTVVDAELSLEPKKFDFGPAAPAIARTNSAPDPFLQYPFARRQNPSALNALNELTADTIQSAAQLLLHLTPRHETNQVDVPAASLGALLSTLRNLNYLCANADACDGESQVTPDLRTFIVGEMLQRVGDILSGQAAQGGVDLVISDASDGRLAHGDIQGASLLVTHIVRQMLACASPADVVEMGLTVTETAFVFRLSHSPKPSMPRGPVAESPFCQAMIQSTKATLGDESTPNEHVVSLQIPMSPVQANQATSTESRLRGKTITLCAFATSIFFKNCMNLISQWGLQEASDGANPDIILIDDDLARLQLEISNLAPDFATLPQSSYPSTDFDSQGKPFIVHATSIARFASAQNLASRSPIPVIVIPKPVGPRRLLMTLLAASCAPSQPYSRRGSLETADALSRLHLSIPTGGDVVATPAHEYFTHNSPGTLVMQTPDGRPYGMYFEPLPSNDRKPLLTSRPSSDPLRRRQIARRTPSGSKVEDSPASPESKTPASESSQSVRRRTLPTQGSETIPVNGRERSATMTQRKLSQTSVGSPKNLTPKKTPAPKDAIVPPIKVLIVEDNPINQNILSMFLRKKQIKHDTAKTGLEAVERWRTGGFHLILMDIQLPVMDGIEATKEIRKLEKTNNIGIFPTTPTGDIQRSTSTETPSTPLRSSVIIVALTASSLQSDRVGALAAGCNDFLTKPVSLKWLDRKIVEWGCMQALIDFDGWRRSKGADGGGAFNAEAQRAAKSLASRMKIDRKKPVSPASLEAASELTSIREDAESPVVKAT
ncbi:hypothetical protein BD324DRAFT_597490 [Kockovaella imperatae]|uniref:Response regulatory domain-containing protein n=1 Tax=Kockovaella imperatae TaxID=4999 RepID=A0A1Y1UPJ5_9TREE|nr:hypothetical protein BD324DRAFT_597490 [Kockovaella imperatae]ORX39892.1 hypothetical protein BD324DRAFT_597490 [Kockovaella imperatae]